MSAMVEAVIPSTAAPALALLDEEEPQLQAHALKTLNGLADAFWPEISEAVLKIQKLSENNDFPQNDLASLVAAKVFFHLGELEEALRYALSAGSLFEVNSDSEFANTLRARCIDEYIAMRSKSVVGPDEAGPSNAEPPSIGTSFAKELEIVVERVLQGCVIKGEVREAIGISIESHRLDKLREAIMEGCRTDASRAEALDYCFECAQTLIASRQYRASVLNLISEIHLKHFSRAKRNHLAVANCLAFTQDAQGVVDVLTELVSGEAGEDADTTDLDELTALQIAFDIVDNDEPHFAAEVCSLLSLESVGRADATETAEAPKPDDGDATGGNAGADDDDGDAMETEPLLSSEPATTESSDKELSPTQKKVQKLKDVLGGKVTAELSLDFLCSQNRSDGYLLKKIKQSLDGRSSVCHSALIFANAIAHGGTAIDNFLRENLDWLARATAWAKFSATSCLGVIHARHTSSALRLLSPYLPSAGSSSGSTSPSAYSEGGALYALGLIAASGGRDVALPTTDGTSSDAKVYLLEALRNVSGNEVVQHGACLGLGLASMASWNGSGENEIYDALKTVLRSDSAVGSEAAGIGIGLLCLGSEAEAVTDEMLEYARETQHEKIIRGIAMGLALISYGREDDADPLIKTLTTESDAILRYGGMYAVALAYCGTGDNKAIRLLLHAAVSDLSDDVRRAAVTAIGFVLFRHPKQVPRIVALLSESCHAHVRYGSALAIGIACAGTGLPSAVEILERLTSDSTDFVRQGALIALALVFMHHTEERSPKAAEIRRLFETTWSAKLEDSITRFGAVVASGLIDAGGRNGSISLTSTTGHRRMSTIVGLAMFTQFWYWFPLVHFIGLSIKPSALIGLDKDLKMPEFQVACDAPPGMFGYVPGGPPEKTKEAVKAPTAVLSVTAKSKAKQQRRAAAKKKDDDDDASMVDIGKDAPAADAKASSSGTPTEPPATKDGEKPSASAEKKQETHSVLKNPCRVVLGQEKYIRWKYDKKGLCIEPRYVPVKPQPANSTGVVMVRDLKPGTPATFVQMQSLSASANTTQNRSSTENTSGAAPESSEDKPDSAEVAPPAAFQYTDED